MAVWLQKNTNSFYLATVDEMVSIVASYLVLVLISSEGKYAHLTWTYLLGPDYWLRSPSCSREYPQWCFRLSCLSSQRRSEKVSVFSMMSTPCPQSLNGGVEEAATMLLTLWLCLFGPSESLVQDKSHNLLFLTITEGGGVHPSLPGGHGSPVAWCGSSESLGAASAYQRRKAYGYTRPALGGSS